MRYLRVIGWGRYQHYRNRRAPWIKAHTDILNPIEHPTFTNLSDGAKLTLHHVRLLAGVTANEIPENLVTRDRLNMKTPPRITELIEAGFAVWIDGSEVAACDVAFAAGGSQLSSPLASEQAETALASGDRVASADASEASLRAHSRAPSRGRSQGFDSKDLASREEPDSKAKSKSKAKSSSRASARELVENFVVTEKHAAWAADQVPGVAVSEATEQWRDHFRNNDYRTRTGPVCDADAAWRNWMRNELKFHPEKRRNRPDDSASLPFGAKPPPPTPMSREDQIRMIASSVYEFIGKYGDPDTNERASVAFESAYVRDLQREPRWPFWKSLCAEIGISPKPEATH
jgi:hypothetical protein